MCLQVPQRFQVLTKPIGSIFRHRLIGRYGRTASRCVEADLRRVRYGDVYCLREGATVVARRQTSGSLEAGEAERTGRKMSNKTVRRPLSLAGLWQSRKIPRVAISSIEKGIGFGPPSAKDFGDTYFGDVTNVRP